MVELPGLILNCSPNKQVLSAICSRVVSTSSYLAGIEKMHTPMALTQWNKKSMIAYALSGSCRYGVRCRVCQKKSLK